MESLLDRSLCFFRDHDKLCGFVFVVFFGDLSLRARERKREAAERMTVHSRYDVHGNGKFKTKQNKTSWW